MTWCFYLIGTHPEVEEKMYQEIMDVLGEDGQPTFENHRQLVWVYIYLGIKCSQMILIIKGEAYFITFNMGLFYWLMQHFIFMQVHEAGVRRSSTFFATRNVYVTLRRTRDWSRRLHRSSRCHDDTGDGRHSHGFQILAWAWKVRFKYHL